MTRRDKTWHDMTWTCEEQISGAWDSSFGTVLQQNYLLIHWSSLLSIIRDVQFLLTGWEIHFKKLLFLSIWLTIPSQHHIFILLPDWIRDQWCFCFFCLEEEDLTIWTRVSEIITSRWIEVRSGCALIIAIWSSHAAHWVVADTQWCSWYNKTTGCYIFLYIFQTMRNHQGETIFCTSLMTHAVISLNQVFVHLILQSLSSHLRSGTTPWSTSTRTCEPRLQSQGWLEGYRRTENILSLLTGSRVDETVWLFSCTIDGGALEIFVVDLVLRPTKRAESLKGIVPSLVMLPTSLSSYSKPE